MNTEKRRNGGNSKRRGGPPALAGDRDRAEPRIHKRRQRRLSACEFGAPLVPKPAKPGPTPPPVIPADVWLTNFTGSVVADSQGRDPVAGNGVPTTRRSGRSGAV